MVHGFIEFPTAGSLTHRFLDSLTYCFTDWVIHCFGDSLTHWIVEWLVHWFTKSLLDWFIESMNHWSLIYCFIASLNLFTDSFIQWVTGLLLHCFIQVCGDSAMWFFSHLNNHLLSCWCTLQLQHFIASASEKLSYRPLNSYIHVLFLKTKRGYHHNHHRSRHHHHHHHHHQHHHHHHHPCLLRSLTTKVFLRGKLYLLRGIKRGILAAKISGSVGESFAFFATWFSLWPQSNTENEGVVVMTGHNWVPS